MCVCVCVCVSVCVSVNESDHLFSEPTVEMRLSVISLSLYVSLSHCESLLRLPCGHDRQYRICISFLAILMKPVILIVE